jgi:hypothetical protein
MDSVRFMWQRSQLSPPAALSTTKPRPWGPYEPDTEFRAMAMQGMRLTIDPDKAGPVGTVGDEA